MDAETRDFMECRFGFDFSPMRIHADRPAADAATSIDARAYTIGEDMVFGSGSFAPRASEGRRLLAHESTHVVQQAGGPAPRTHASGRNVEGVRAPSSLAKMRSRRARRTN